MEIFKFCKIKKLLGLLFLVATISCKEQPKNVQQIADEIKVDYLAESEKIFDDRMAWWRDASFGMFIHWGPYAVPAGIHNGKETDHIGEWIMNDLQIPISEYEAYAKQFNPKEFDAKKWAKIMKDAGMKYVVITSKHHDGFALWDSKISNYDIVDHSVYGKDLLKALSKACKEEGIKFGLYHSIMDWHHPMAQGKNYPNYDERDSLRINPEFPKYYENYLKAQLKELIENYDPEIIWFDGEWIPSYTHEMGLELYQYLRELKPSIIINNRVDKGRQGMQGMNSSEGKYIGDFGTPEQEILESSPDVDWESCMTMNDTWGFKINDHNWKSTKTLVHNLIDVVAKGGNYLLNVGPNANGEIPKASIERLSEIGKWIHVNGEAIYHTEKLKHHFKQGESIRYIKKKNSATIYAVSLEKPKHNLINLKYVKPIQGSKIYLLGFDEPLTYSFTEKNGLNIKIDKEVFKAVGETYAYTLKIKGEERSGF
ncbi:alpha-L-fucosidase [Flavicella sediminum]|uniref:alpha-L-fucosidase n=1 Tax=Flavicella sediminum TaxID=2585141 RepID=UPI00111CB802|nr:alpha-L-fucosidase [Flavicella sediminum]